jgi:hypothetical protein
VCYGGPVQLSISLYAGYYSSELWELDEGRSREEEVRMLGFECARDARPLAGGMVFSLSVLRQLHLLVSLDGGRMLRRNFEYRRPDLSGWGHCRKDRLQSVEPSLASWDSESGRVVYSRSLTS